MLERIIKKYANLVKSQKRILIKRYYSNLFQDCGSKDLWCNINSVLGKKSSKENIEINSIVLNGTLLTVNRDISNTLNSYFVNVAVNLAKNIPQPS